jgi:hypothetical protein
MRSSKCEVLLMRAYVEKCHVGSKYLLVLGEKLLPFLQRMDKRLLQSAQGENLPGHNVTLELSLSLTFWAVCVWIS